MTRRQKAIGFFITLCVLLVGAAILGWIYWIVITEKLTVGTLVGGILLFALIIAGLIIYTVFLVLEIKRNEEHDTFINSVTPRAQDSAGVDPPVSGHAEGPAGL
jgi:hypothetical protein